MLPKPQDTEYAPYYAVYVERVSSSDVVESLQLQVEGTLALLRGMTEEQAMSRYAPGKWTVKDVVQHLIDTERIFSYRLLRFARGDPNPLPGFDQEPYVLAAQAERRPLPELCDELELVRGSTVCLLRSLQPEAALRRGVASGNAFTVRALAWIIAGHEAHHVAVLRERYLPALR